MSDFTYLATDEDASCALAWLDRNGSAVDLSTGTFSVKLVNSAGTATVTKTGSTITGYSALQGTSPQQYNLLISWAAGELAIAAGLYTLIVQATISSRQRTFRPGDPPTVLIVAAPS